MNKKTPYFWLCGCKENNIHSVLTKECHLCQKRVTNQPHAELEDVVNLMQKLVDYLDQQMDLKITLEWTKEDWAVLRVGVVNISGTTYIVYNSIMNLVNQQMMKDLGVLK